VKRLAQPAAAALYCVLFCSLGVLSARALPGTVCGDVYFGFREVQARSSLGLSLPVPVIQMCAGYALPLLLAGFTLAACAAWALVARARARVGTAAVCAAVALAAAIAFPYVPSTDPYAYALYGYEAMHGITPYADTVQAGSPQPEPLAKLYQFFPRPSSNRVANYGPLAVLQYEAVARVSGNSLGRFVLLLRCLNAALLLALAWLLTLLRPPGTARVQAAWVAFHPLLLLESVAFAHGDLLMIVLLCAALVLYRRGAYSLCAAVIVAAAEVRLAAALALLVLCVEVDRRYGISRLVRTVAAAAATLGVSAAASIVAYGSFTLGGAPAIEAFSSPAILAFNAFGVTMRHVAAGLLVQAAFGLLCIAVVLRLRRYLYLPFAALAGLPIMRAWYCQWLVPIAALERDSAAGSAALTAASVAILAEYPAMTAHSDAATWSIILALQWLLPLAAARLFASQAVRPTARAAKANRSTSALSQSTTPAR
jgi:hypothetical protein